MSNIDELIKTLQKIKEQEGENLTVCCKMSDANEDILTHAYYINIKEQNIFGSTKKIIYISDEEKENCKSWQI